MYVDELRMQDALVINRVVDFIEFSFQTRYTVHGQVRWKISVSSSQGCHAAINTSYFPLRSFITSSGDLSVIGGK